MNVERDGPPDTGYLSSQDLQDQSVLLGDCFHGKSERPICQSSSLIPRVCSSRSINSVTESQSVPNIADQANDILQARRMGGTHFKLGAHPLLLNNAESCHWVSLTARPSAGSGSMRQLHRGVACPPNWASSSTCGRLRTISSYDQCLSLPAGD